MRLIGLLVISTIVFLVLRMAKGGGAVGTRRCPHCGQQIPELGAYCPICGKKVV